MSMSWSEHLAQAERLLKETAESPTVPAEERLVWAVEALAHASCANSKRIFK